MRSHRLLPWVVVATLLLGACSYQDLVAFGNTAQGAPFTASDNPAVQAAAMFNPYREEDRDRAIDDARENRDLDAIDQVEANYPDDYRPVMTSMAMRLAAGDPNWRGELGTAVGLVEGQLGYPDHASEEDVKRVVEQEQLIAMSELLDRPQSGDDQAAVLTEFCASLAAYLQYHGGSEDNGDFLNAWRPQDRCPTG
jgi:hypothetical protein